MQTMSPFWLPAMQADTLNIVAYAEIWTPPSVGNPNGVFLDRLVVTDGGVTIDATNAIRRTAQQVTLVPSPVDVSEGYPIGVPVPSVNSDLLFPIGNEMILYKGYWRPDNPRGYPQLTLPWLNGGQPVAGEVATLGRFLMEDVEIYNTPGSGNVYIELNGRDRGGTVDRDKFATPYATDGTSILATQLQALINGQVPNLTYNITPTTIVPAQMTFNIGDSPWSSALALAASAGYELYPDPQGIIVARPVLNPAQLPTTVTYQTGLPNSIVTSIQRSLISSSVPNVIIVVSQGSNVGTPLISYWWDSNQNSPTFYNTTVPVPGSNMSTLPGAQGTYPTTIAEQTGAAATTQIANDAIAQSMGFASKGSIETVDIKIRDNPAQDADDVVAVLDAATTIVTKAYVLDTLTMQLAGRSEMEAKGRLVV